MNLMLLFRMRFCDSKLPMHDRITVDLVHANQLRRSTAHVKAKLLTTEICRTHLEQHKVRVKKTSIQILHQRLSPIVNDPTQTENQVAK
jgi:hypothetical protein